MGMSNVVPLHPDGRSCRGPQSVQSVPTSQGGRPREEKVSSDRWPPSLQIPSFTIRRSRDAGQLSSQRASVKQPMSHPGCWGGSGDMGGAGGSAGGEGGEGGSNGEGGTLGGRGDVGGEGGGGGGRDGGDTIGGQAGGPGGAGGQHRLARSFPV